MSPDNSEEIIKVIEVDQESLPLAETTINQECNLKVPHKKFSERNNSFMKSEFSSFNYQKFNPKKHESRKKILENIISDLEIDDIKRHLTTKYFLII